MNILLGVTGSVAAGLTPKLAVALKELGEVQVVTTPRSLEFIPATWDGNLLPGVKVWQDAHEWGSYSKGSPVLHIDLKNWADVLVIAPCTANTLAKMATGLADNLLTNVVRAWPSHKPLIVAPAMNTDMWDKPSTRRQLGALKADYPNFRLVEPQEKVLACRDTGMGAMADISAIVEEARKAAGLTDEHYKTMPASHLSTRFWMQAGGLFDAVVAKYRERFVQRQDGADKVFGAVCLPNRDGTAGGICSPREKGKAFTVMDAVEVTNVQERIIYVNDPQAKATLNAPLLIRVGQKYPQAAAILHLHEQLPGVPTVPFAPPSTVRDNEREIPGPVFNIEGHGFIACLDRNLDIWGTTDGNL